MRCDPSTSGGSSAAPSMRACSEVGDGSEHIHLARDRSKDSDRFVNEEGHIGDDEDGQDDLPAAGEAGTSPEIRERKGTENQEEQDQDPHRAVVPLGRCGSPRREHDIYSVPRDVNAPEEGGDE